MFKPFSVCMNEDQTAIRVAYTRMAKRRTAHLTVDVPFVPSQHRLFTSPHSQKGLTLKY